MIKAVVLIVAFFTGAVARAEAQVVIDVAKITCDQFTKYKITTPRNIAIWLSGYYNGKRGTTVVDATQLKANAQKLVEECIRKPKITVMSAVESLFGGDNR